MKNILLALDVEHFDDRLLNFALNMCRPIKAKLWIVHVSPYAPERASANNAPDYIRFGVVDDLAEEHKILQKLTRRMQDQTVDAAALLVGGEIVQALLQQAKSIPADLIIMGVHDHGFLANALGGNTAIAMLRKTKVPLLCFPL